MKKSVKALSLKISKIISIKKAKIKIMNLKNIINNQINKRIKNLSIKEI
jgi:hypothetical protein